MNEKDIETKPDEIKYDLFEDSEDFGFNIHYHKKSTDNIEDFDEDIPFSQNWKRESVESMKETLCDWIDHNLKHESETNPVIYSKENETRLYFKVNESGGSDQENDGDGYFCVFEKFNTRKVEMTDVKFQ